MSVSTMFRVSIISSLIFTIMVSSTGSVTAQTASQQSSPGQLVDALHSAFGNHSARAVHAKGIILEGTFTPATEATGITSAGHFRNGKLPVVVRFSDFTGIPDISDANGLANPRGFAIKFKLPDSSSTDIVGHSFNGFPTATKDDFRELLLAMASSGPEATKPTNLDKFLGSHPIAKTFLTTQNPAPVSKDPAPANPKTFILVHGAWPASWVWKDVKTQLESQGEKVMVVELPAHGVYTTSPANVSIEIYRDKVITAINKINGKVYW